MKTTYQVEYRHFCKGFDYYENSMIESIKQRIIEDGGKPVIYEDETSLQIAGIFKAKKP